MKLLDAGEPCRLDDLLIGGGGLAKRDVVAQLAEEQIGVLHHEADAGAQIGGVVLPRASMPSTEMPPSVGS